MKTKDTTYRTAVGVAVVATLLLFWVNGAVGIIGSDDDPANAMYAAVLAVGFAGAVLARFRPLGMSRTLLAMAAVQASITVIAIAAGLGAPVSGPLELLLLNGFFVALFVGSALLFRRAARRRRLADAGATD